MRIAELTLGAPSARMGDLRHFYGRELGLGVSEPAEGSLAVHVGHEQLIFQPAAGGEPFYHFALLVPGDLFQAARAWAEERVDLLPDPDSGEVVFDFDAWDAQACYFHDPAGNIVELIAHRGEGLSVTDSFIGADLLGISEIGLVCDDLARAAAELQAGLGLEVWAGSAEDPDGLAFVGSKAHTLILAPVARGWMPTNRRAEVHPTSVLLEGVRAGNVSLTGLPYRLAAEAA